MLRYAALIIVLIAPAFAGAAVYQCKVNGQMVFSDQPCGDGAKQIEVKAPPVSGSGPMVTDNAKQFMAHRETMRKVQLVEREIDRLRAERLRILQTE